MKNLNEDVMFLFLQITVGIGLLAVVGVLIAVCIKVFRWALT